jgi:hypothetical protein
MGVVAATAAATKLPPPVMHRCLSTRRLVVVSPLLPPLVEASPLIAPLPPVKLPESRQSEICLGKGLNGTRV